MSLIVDGLNCIEVEQPQVSDDAILAEGLAGHAERVALELSGKIAQTGGAVLPTSSMLGSYGDVINIADQYGANQPHVLCITEESYKPFQMEQFLGLYGPGLVHQRCGTTVDSVIRDLSYSNGYDELFAKMHMLCNNRNVRFARMSLDQNLDTPFGSCDCVTSQCVNDVWVQVAFKKSSWYHRIYYRVLFALQIENK